MDRVGTKRVTLYVAGASPQSTNAVRVVTTLLRNSQDDICLRVIDVHREPQAAYRDGVLTVPAAVFVDSNSKAVISGAFTEERLGPQLGAGE